MLEAIHEAVDPYSPFVEDGGTIKERVEDIFTNFVVRQVALVPYAGLNENPTPPEVIVPKPESFWLTKPA